MTEIYAAHMARAGADRIDGARRALRERPAAPPGTGAQAGSRPRTNAQTSPVRWVRRLTMADEPAEPAPQAAPEAPPAAATAAEPRPLRNQDSDLAGYTRAAAHEIDSLFSRLPNPDLVMYVYPHLAGPDNTPVPGYATSFPMYERVEYALPGEAPSRAPGPMRHPPDPLQAPAGNTGRPAP